MKRFLFVAALATLMAVGCQKTQVINPVSGTPMTFTTEMNKLTKSATAEGMVNLETQGFNVWAYADFEDAVNAKPDLDLIYDEIEGVAITKSGNVWQNPDKDYYWPGENKMLWFFAVSGVDKATVAPKINRTDAGVVTSSVSPTLEIENFTVTDESVDVMVADFVHQSQNSKTGDKAKSVELNFRHALSKVQFLFRTEDGTGNASGDVVLIQHIEIDHVKTTAKLTATPNLSDETLASKPVTLKWGTPTGDVKFEEDYDGDNLPNKAVDSDFASDILWLDEDETEHDMTAMKLTAEAKPFATWLWMPQTLTYNDGTQDLPMTIKILYIMGKRQMEAIFELNADNLITEWTENQYIRYTITLTPNKITFNPDVADWSQYDSDQTTDGNQDINMGN